MIGNGEEDSVEESGVGSGSGSEPELDDNTENSDADEDDGKGKGKEPEPSELALYIIYFESLVTCFVVGFRRNFDHVVVTSRGRKRRVRQTLAICICEAGMVVDPSNVGPNSEEGLIQCSDKSCERIWVCQIYSHLFVCLLLILLIVSSEVR